MSFQFYWPNWWKLIPSFNKISDPDLPVVSNTFCWGILQFHWYS